LQERVGAREPIAARVRLRNIQTHLVGGRVP
jgi:hypothetical protein